MFEHNTYLQSVASRFVPSCDIEDVVNDAYVKALESQDSFEGRSKPQTWLYRITVNVAKSRIRRKHLVPEPTDDVDVFVVDQDPSTKVYLEYILARITPSRRATMLMLAQGYKLTEIAEELGVQKGTVAACIYRERERLEQEVRYE